MLTDLLPRSSGPRASLESDRLRTLDLPRDGSLLAITVHTGTFALADG